MKQQEFHPVETPAGYIKGRDAIFLDGFEVQISPWLIKLKGDVNGKLTSQNLDNWFACELVFSNVIAFKVIELDLWDYKSASSFDEIVNSTWIKKLGGKVDSVFKHYLLQTYDNVIEVVCQQFNLQLRERQPRHE